MAATDCKGVRVALVIGNMTYPDSEVPLKGTVEAAHHVGEALRAVGFDVQVGENLNKMQTDAAVRALQAKVKPGAAVFLFFSGFGVQAGGHTYLLPVDASIWSEADIATNGLNLDRVLTEIEEKKAAVEVLVIDAARRNPFERRFRASGSAGLAPPTASSGNLVALLSAPPDKVFDAADLSAEPFAIDVAREIAAPHATAQDAFRQVRSIVARTSRAGQNPWGFTTLADDLPLDIHDCSGSPDRVVPPQTAEAAPVRDVTAEPAVKPQVPTQPATPPDRPATPLPTMASAAPAAARPDVPDASPTTPQAPAAAPLPVEQAMVSVPPPLDSKTSRFQIALQDNNLLDETRERLFEQNLDPGAVGSDKMREAIHTFEQHAGLPEVAQPTLGLLDALRATPSLGPWGAITVASDVKHWGMAWDKPSRTQALAEARLRCGNRRCTEDITFHGQGCGAFALSPKRWNVSQQDGGDAARKTALSDCSKAGAACRVIGSVCADGSDKTN